MKYLRLLLFPFSLLYAVVVIIRNLCYDAGLFKSRRFNLPVISVGNLDVGGAGKSPMTEYLIKLLKTDHKLATLSRGYGRKTEGYVERSQKSKIKSQNLPPDDQISLATHNLQPTTHHSPLTKALEIGDEPAQFAQKFPGITVAVCEDRVKGIERLQNEHDLIILDDAYQHRAVKPGLSILLFDYGRLNSPRLLLPAGNLREPFSGRKRASMLVISKCPDKLSAVEQAAIIKRIKPFPGQPVFFTAITYHSIQNINGGASNMVLNNNTCIFLLTGIANAKPLLQYLQKHTLHIIHHNYPDHHRFSLKNIAKLAAEFSACATQNKVVITTEKDAQRLLENELLPVLRQLPVLVVPIGIKFLNNTGSRFDQLVTDYVREHTKHHQVH